MLMYIPSRQFKLLNITKCFNEKPVRREGRTFLLLHTIPHHWMTVTVPVWTIPALAEHRELSRDPFLSSGKNHRMQDFIAVYDILIFRLIILKLHLHSRN